MGREACPFTRRRWHHASCFCLKTGFPLARGCFKHPGANSLSSPVKPHSLPPGGKYSRPQGAVPRAPDGCQAVPEGCPARKVTCWRGCRARRVRRGGGGIPARSSRVTEVPAPPPSPLTCPLRVTQAAGKRCPYLGADLVRQLPDATPPSCPSQAGTGPAASHILRWDAGSGSPHESELGGGQTAFPGVISHLQGFS